MDYDHSPSLKSKLKRVKTICSSCCPFTTSPSSDSEDETKNVLETSPKARLSAWIKSELPAELKGIFSCVKNTRQRGNHNGAAEYRYDPLSYALNFEDDVSRFDEEYYPLRNFSARLPASPKKNIVVSKEIAAWS